MYSRKQGCFNILPKKCNIALKQSQGQSHMIISIDVEKAFDKIHHTFKLKALKKLETEGTYLNIIKAVIYNKVIGTTIPNDYKLKQFPLKS
jgi:retron-type reverse transcriptase